MYFQRSASHAFQDSSSAAVVCIIWHDANIAHTPHIQCHAYTDARMTNDGRLHAGGTLVDAARPRVWIGTGRAEIPHPFTAIGAGGYDGLRRQHGHTRPGGFL